MLYTINLKKIIKSNKKYFHFEISLIFILEFKTSIIISSLIKKECVPKIQVPFVESLSFPSIILHSFVFSSYSKQVWYRLKDLSLGKEKSHSLCLPIVTNFCLFPSKILTFFLFVKFTISNSLLLIGFIWNMILPAEIISFCFIIYLFLFLNFIKRILLSLPFPE